MAGSPPRGYTPVPTEERIDDDVEVRQNDGNETDDDDRYASNDPLLSRSQRDVLPVSGSSRWRFPRTNIFRSRFFQAKVFHPTRWPWPEVKMMKQNKIMKWVIFFLSILILGLVISLAVIGKLYDKSRHRYCRNYYSPRYYHNTHLPYFNSSDTSWNFGVSFPRIFPPLAASVDSSCKAAWEQMSYVSCHEKIFNRAWDDGKRNLFDPEISLYAEPMCRSSCLDDLKRHQQLLYSKCTREDKFAMSNYVGTFSADPGLEDGPVAVLETIAARLEHTCRRSPAARPYYHSWYDFCVADVYNIWFIVDGMNAGNLEGLDVFERLTSVPKEDWAAWDGYRSNSFADADDAANAYTTRRRIRVGPGKNQTECDWCLLNWFERKMMAWKKDGVLDPKNGTVVELPDYIRRISRLGSRCQSSDWNRIYRRAVKQYKDYGMLPPDWTGKEDKEPEFSIEADTTEPVTDDEVFFS